MADESINWQDAWKRAEDKVRTVRERGPLPIPDPAREARQRANASTREPIGKAYTADENRKLDKEKQAFDSNLKRQQMEWSAYRKVMRGEVMPTDRAPEQPVSPEKRDLTHVDDPKPTKTPEPVKFNAPPASKDWHKDNADPEERVAELQSKVELPARTEPKAAPKVSVQDEKRKVTSANDPIKPDTRTPYERMQDESKINKQKTQARIQAMQEKMAARRSELARIEHQQHVAKQGLLDEGQTYRTPTRDMAEGPTETRAVQGSPVEGIDKGYTPADIRAGKPMKDWANRNMAERKEERITNRASIKKQEAAELKKRSDAFSDTPAESLSKWMWGTMADDKSGKDVKKPTAPQAAEKTRKGPAVEPTAADGAKQGFNKPSLSSAESGGNTANKSVRMEGELKLTGTGGQVLGTGAISAVGKFS